jgi:hypothetical protein
MDHPYRVIVTSAGQRFASVYVARVLNNEVMPARARSPLVEKVLHHARVPLPRGERAGVCMPPRPVGLPETPFARELQKAYAIFDALASAPLEVKIYG